ncbi:MAG: adenine deaminase [Deltaproteobacteria bacterium]|jgi:adenine deaminase|nr:adenine deaminase [Deltaproteobacteria bacterium]
MKRSSVKHRIDVAAGRKPADLLLTGGRVVSVLADEIVKTDVAIADGVIVGFGSYEAKKKINLKGGYLSSGLIDSHIHIESTLLTPAEFAKTVVPKGTTSVVADPHEIANVMGSRGIKWILQASEGLPIDINIVLPSCVPASKFESSWAKLGSKELKKLAHLPRVVGIGEVMDFPGVIEGRNELLKKIRLIPGMRVDGHAPGLTGKNLNAYIAAGIHSDHESTTASEAREKLIAGLHIMIREGTTEKNLIDLASIVTPANSHRCFFCSDDRSAHDLIKRGHVDDILRMAVKAGIPPITALQMATNNAPYYFRLKRRKGAVAIGYVADLVVFDDLKNFRAKKVFKDGKLVAKNGKLLAPCTPSHKPPVGNSVHIKKISKNALKISGRNGKVRAIKLVPNQITTLVELIAPKISDGLVVSDIERDLLKVAVIERHHSTGRVGLGLVRGFGIQKGALASTVCHDAHNLIVVGTNDEDMLIAADALKKSGGGFAASSNGKILDVLPLPIAGLMSDKSAPDVAENYDRIERASKKLGSKIENPFLSLSFMSLSVVPRLRITDRGLLDVEEGKIVSLFN